MKNEFEIIDKIFSIVFEIKRCDYTNILNETGLSIENLKILMFIRRGIKTQKEMKSFTPESAASLTQKINKLVGLGYVEKKENKKDARSIFLTITKKGQREILKIDKIWVEESKKFFSDFKEKEKKDLYLGLKKLDEKIKEIKKNNKK